MPLIKNQNSSIVIERSISKILFDGQPRTTASAEVCLWIETAIRTPVWGIVHGRASLMPIYTKRYEGHFE